MPWSACTGSTRWRGWPSAVLSATWRPPATRPPCGADLCRPQRLLRERSAVCHAGARRARKSCLWAGQREDPHCAPAALPPSGCGGDGGLRRGRRVSMTACMVRPAGGSVRAAPGAARRYRRDCRADTDTCAAGTPPAIAAATLPTLSDTAQQPALCLPGAVQIRSAS